MEGYGNAIDVWSPDVSRSRGTLLAPWSSDARGCQISVPRCIHNHSSPSPALQTASSKDSFCATKDCLAGKLLPLPCAAAGLANEEICHRDPVTDAAGAVGVDPWHI